LLWSKIIEYGHEDHGNDQPQYEILGKVIHMRVFKLNCSIVVQVMWADFTLLA
jgi:hypothetical protein